MNKFAMRLQERIFNKLIFSLVFLLIMINLSAQSLRQDIWVDSVFSTMNEDQRISQLLMIAAYSNKDEKHINKIKSQFVIFLN